ncbi:hypothetical protein MMPV_001816 [Pyropia vietnamensis]
MAASSIGAFKPPAGKSCKCARASSPGACLVLVRYDEGSKTQGVCRPGGEACDAPWTCTDESPTHVCLSQVVTSWLQCKLGTGGGEVCPCVRHEVDDLSLMPTQLLPDGRGGGKPKPLPPPQKPSCKANHAIISVEGTPWQCVKSMNIEKRTAPAACDYGEHRNNGWKTNDDYVNLNFLRDTASRLYMCVTYGSSEASDLPDVKRTASSVVTSTTPNRFYFQDDGTKPNDNGGSYTPANGSPAHELSSSHRWSNLKTDRYCVDVASEMVVDFSDLSYIKGLALGKGGGKYPATGDWAFWNMRTMKRTAPLAYDAAGRVYPAKMQAEKWMESGIPPSNCVHRVTVTAACDCYGWMTKARAAAQMAAA